MENQVKKNQLYAALAKAQGEFETVVFDKFNPHYKNKYASIAAIRKAIEPALCKYGISMIQPWEMRDNGDIVLYTKLLHESGEEISSSCLIAKGNKSDQLMGASVTYMKRYQMSSLLGIFAEEDDDGELSEGRITAPQDIQPKPKKPVEEVPPKPETPKAKTISKEQIESIRSKIKEFPSLREDILKAMNVKLIADIEQESYNTVMAIIDLKLKHEGVA